MAFALLQSRRPRSQSLALFSHLGALGLFLFAILDSSPVPTFAGADILLIILVVTRPHPWYEFAAAATAGSVIGAFLTFRAARRAGKQFLYGKFGTRSVSKLLSYFDQWGPAIILASTAIPLPLPTGFFFAAAGASDRYTNRRFLIIVALARAVRYSTIGLIAHLYGRHIIRVLRHPVQNLGWFALFAAIFVAVIAVSFAVKRRGQTAVPGGVRS